MEYKIEYSSQNAKPYYCSVIGKYMVDKKMPLNEVKRRVEYYDKLTDTTEINSGWYWVRRAIASRISVKEQERVHKKYNNRYKDKPTHCSLCKNYIVIGKEWIDYDYKLKRECKYTEAERIRLEPCMTYIESNDKLKRPEQYERFRRELNEAQKFSDKVIKSNKTTEELIAEGHLCYEEIIKIVMERMFEGATCKGSYEKALPKVFPEVPYNSSIYA